MALVEIYEKPLCPYCRRARELLTRKKVSFLAIDISRNAKRRDEMIRRAGGRYTVPQIFIDGIHVGGSDDLHALERNGRLDAMLAGTTIDRAMSGGPIADAPRQSEVGTKFTANESGGRRRLSHRVSGLSWLLTKLASVCFR